MKRVQDELTPECIDKDILKEFLIKHRAEVRTVILEEGKLWQISF